MADVSAAKVASREQQEANVRLLAKSVNKKSSAAKTAVKKKTAKPATGNKKAAKVIGPGDRLQYKLWYLIAIQTLPSNDLILAKLTQGRTPKKKVIGPGNCRWFAIQTFGRLASLT